MNVRMHKIIVHEQYPNSMCQLTSKMSQHCHCSSFIKIFQIKFLNSVVKLRRRLENLNKGIEEKVPLAYKQCDVRQMKMAGHGNILIDFRNKCIWAIAEHS